MESDYRHNRIAIVRRRINVNLLLIAFLITVFSVLHVLLRNDIRRKLREAEQARQEIQRASQQNAYLQAEITRLTSPEYIRGIAEKDLGMSDAPNGPIVLRYDKGLDQDVNIGEELAFSLSTKGQNKE